MKTVVINYKITSELTSDKFHAIIEGCRSQKHQIELNLFDFSLKKLIANYLKEKPYPDISIRHVSEYYESIPNADSIVLSNLIRHGNSTAFCIVSENAVFYPGCLDEIDFDWLSDDLNGFIYFDFHLNNIRCYMRSRAMGSQLSLPIVFWSTDKLIRHLGEENKIDIVGNNYASLHIPKSICTVSQDEK